MSLDLRFVFKTVLSVSASGIAIVLASVPQQVHTNGIENFWSLLKRGLNGTYVAVEPYHLHRYVGEQAFRYNNRATEGNPLNDYDRFMLALSQISGKRLTYAELTGKVGETESGDSPIF